MEKVRIVEIRVGKELKVSEIENSLTSMQSFVGGLIECMDFSVGNSILTFVLNEEGKLEQLPGNFNIAVNGKLEDVVVGDVFVTAYDEGESRSLTDKEIEDVYNLFSERYMINLNF